MANNTVIAKKAVFLIELRTCLPAEDFAWVLVALNQDALVWRSLEHTDLGARALAIFLDSPEQWNPAALALLELQEALPQTADILPVLKAGSDCAIDQALLCSAARVYQEWLDGVQQDATLRLSGLVALTWRSNLGQSQFWRQLETDLQSPRPGAATALACLFAMLPEPWELLANLVQPVYGQPGFDLALHALLSNPLSEEKQAVCLQPALAALAPAQKPVFLRKLACQRPQLAARLACQALTDSPAVNPLDDRDLPVAAGADELAVHYQALVSQLAQAAELHSLASQPAQVVRTLAQSIRAVRRLQGHLSAQLAQAVEQAQRSSCGAGHEQEPETQSAALEAWRQAVQFLPEEACYSVALGAALVEAGRTAEAQPYLLKGAQAAAPQPGLALARVRAELRLGDQEAALRFTRQAFHAFENGAGLDQQHAIDLLRLFLKFGKPEHALRVAELALRIYPGSFSLRSLLARLQSDAGQPQEALHSAALALALAASEDGETQSGALPTSDASPASDVSSAVEGLRRLFVHNLELVGEWETALQERNTLLAALSSPVIDEFLGLARCAQRAGKPAQALQACRQALQIDPENDQALVLSAQVSLALGEPAAAVEQLRKAIRRAPHHTEYWLTLAQAHQANAQPEQALEILRTASQALPNAADVHLALGELYLAANQATQALSSLRRAEKLAASPHSALRLGQTLVQLGHYAEALQLLSHAVERPGARQADVWAGLALTYAQALRALGDLPLAVQMFTEVVGLRPDDPQARLELAQALLSSADQAAAQQAIEHLEKALDVISTPTSEATQDCQATSPSVLLEARVRASLAEACRVAGDLPRALENYRRVFELPASDCLGVYFNAGDRCRLAAGFGRVALQLDQPQTAVTILKEALRLDPGDLALLRLLSESYLACGLPLEAFETAQAVLDRSPASIENLNWFIDQGLRIEETPAGAQLPVRQQVINALDFASRLAPSRVDLLIRLGRMLGDEGDRSIALEAFRRLAAAGDDLALLTPGDLFFAGKSLRQLGDPQHANSLLQRAAEQPSVASPGEGNAFTSRIEIFAELAHARYESGEHAQALQVLEQALALDGQQFDLYVLQADIFAKLGQPHRQLASIKSALCVQPAHADLQLRLAYLLRQAGDFSDALMYAEQAVLYASATQEDALLHSARLMAAELAYLLLRTHKAWTWIQDDLANPQPPCEHFEHACLRIEMALDAGEVALASENLAILRRSASKQARVLANQARLVRLGGDGSQAGSLFDAAQQSFAQDAALADGQAVSDAVQLAGLRTLCSAALELHRWDAALSLTRRWVASSPAEPLACMRLAQALVVCAEDTVLSQDLCIVKHSPGKQALGEQAYREFAQVIQQARKLLIPAGAAIDAGGNVNDDLFLWQSRGQAVFMPDRRSLHGFAAALKVITIQPGSLAALLMALRRIGEPAESGVLSNVFTMMGNTWNIPANGSNLAGHPQVLLGKALLLADSAPQQALSLVQRVLDQTAIWHEWPGQPALYYLQAKLSYRLEDNPKAWQAIEKALALWPDESYWHVLAADILRTQVQPDLRGALEHLEQAARLQPDCAAHYLALGKLLLQQEKPQPAARALERAANLRPECDETWLTLASARQMLGELEQAAGSAERAIETASDPTAALLLRSAIALQSNNPRGALSRIQTVLHSQPEHVGALQLAAQALSVLDRPQEALAALDKAIQVSGDASHLYRQRIELLRQAKGPNAALQALQELVERYPERLEFQALLAESLFAADQPAMAVEVAQAVLRAAPEILPAAQRGALHFQVGRQMRRSGQLDQAVAHLTAAVQFDPAQLDSWLELGRVYQEQRAHNQALNTYLQAVDLAPQDYRPYYQAGVALKEAKNYLKAEEMLRQAARLAPDEVSIHRLLGAVVALNLVHNRRTPAGQTR